MSNLAQGDDEFRSYISDFESYLHNIGGEVRHASPEGTLSETMTSSAENYEDSGAWQENGTADGKRLSYCDDIYDEHKRLHDLVLDDDEQYDEDQYELKCNEDYSFKESAPSLPPSAAAPSAAAAGYDYELDYADEQTAEADIGDPMSNNSGLDDEDEPTDSSPVNDVAETDLHHSYVIDEEANSDFYCDERYREPEMIHCETDCGTVEHEENQQEYEMNNDQENYAEHLSGRAVHSETLEYQLETDQTDYTEDEDFENDYENVGVKRFQQNIELAEANFGGNSTADCSASLNCIEANNVHQPSAEVFDEDQCAPGHHYYNEADSYGRNETETDPVSDEGHYDETETETDGSHKPTIDHAEPRPRHHVTFSIEEEIDSDDSGSPAELEQQQQDHNEQRTEPIPVVTPEPNVDEEMTHSQPHEEDDNRPTERGRIKVLLAQWREFEQQQISSGRARSQADQQSSPHVRSRSCGPSSGRRVVAAINPYENRCIDDMSDSCGRRSRWSPDREEDHNDDREENRSISRADILAKFENLGSVGNKVPITTNKKAFKWTVKEPIALQRPVGLRVS